MAVATDFVFLRRLLDQGAVRGDVLEIGSLNWQGHDEGNAKVTCERAGLRWEGADVERGRDVDLLVDILDADAVRAVGRRWDAVLLFNLLEHVYDPIRALDHARRLLAPAGTLVACGPAIWELHDFPADYWRPLPGFYFEYARRNGLRVLGGSPTWMANDRLIPYDALTEDAGDDQHLAPSRRFPAALYGTRKAFPMRVVAHAAHRLGATQGVFPFCSFGIAMQG